VEAVTAMSSYSHAEKLARRVAGTPAGDPPAPPVDPRLYDSPEMRAILGERDIGALFRAVKGTGVSYRTIAALVGMSQSEVSEIISGRRVHSYDVLVRVAQGLGVPRALMGLSYTDGPQATYDGQDGAAAPEVDEAMQRRRFLNAVIGIVVPAVFQHVVPPELLTPMDPLRPAVPTPLPSRITASDVEALRTLTERMRALARHYGGQADTMSAIAIRSMRLLSVPATDPTKQSLQSALADLHTAAGWACVDTRLDDNARKHFATAMELANDAEDPAGMVHALWLSGTSLDEQGHPSDALKLYQLGQVKLTDAHNDSRRPFLSSWLHAESASSYAHLGRADPARSELTAARYEWDPPDENERADMDWLTSLVERHLGQLDRAEHLPLRRYALWMQTPTGVGSRWPLSPSLSCI